MKKTVLITGASRGIGKETARLFAINGYNVAINYNKSEDEAIALLKELETYGYPVIAVKADVSKNAEVVKMVKKVEQLFGKIDVLVNNAGVGNIKLFTDMTEKETDDMINTNVKGVFNVTRAVVPSMISRQDGKIINISSIWGIVGASCEVIYSATKAAVIGFTKALAKELGPSQIQVNCVAPGVIDTDMNKDLDEETREGLKEMTPLGVMGEAKDIAQTVLFLASEQAKFFTGQVISPNGGIIT